MPFNDGTRKEKRYYSHGHRQASAGSFLLRYGSIDGNFIRRLYVIVITITVINCWALLLTLSLVFCSVASPVSGFCIVDFALHRRKSKRNNLVYTGIHKRTRNWKESESQYQSFEFAWMSFMNGIPSSLLNNSILSYFIMLSNMSREQMNDICCIMSSWVWTQTHTLVCRLMYVYGYTNNR